MAKNLVVCFIWLLIHSILLKVTYSECLATQDTLESGKIIKVELYSKYVTNGFHCFNFYHNNEKYSVHVGDTEYSSFSPSDSIEVLYNEKRNHFENVNDSSKIEKYTIGIIVGIICLSLGVIWLIYILKKAFWKK